MGYFLCAMSDIADELEALYELEQSAKTQFIVNSVPTIYRSEQSSPLKSKHFSMDDDDDDLEQLLGKRQMEIIEEPRKKQPFTTVPETNHFVVAKSSDGTVLYFPKKKPLAIPKPTQLLSEPIHRLFLRIQENQERPPLSDIKRPQRELWADKYKPKEYHELLGDEKLNRNVMSWVKTWDYCVFKKEVKRPFMMWQKDRSMKQENTDPLKRPEKRLLLLSGPPGLGKTTLAQVIAKHCGYNILEVNASDERTQHSFNRISSALDTKSSFGNKKPTLVIVDEIDGGMSGEADSFINSLIRLAEEKPTKERNVKRLLRPIICICNDLYSPALKNLKQHCVVFRFQPLQQHIVAQRLQNICQWEKIKADLGALMAIVEVNQSDFRACLNTVQYISRTHDHITLNAVRDFGSKDVSQSWISVASKLFHLKKGDYVSRLHAEIESSGEYDKIMRALHENYLNSNVFDLTVGSAGDSRACQLGESLWFFDLVSKRAYQQHDLQRYIGYPLISFYKLFASAKPMEIVYPKQDYQAHLKHQQTQQTVKSWIRSMPNESKIQYGNEKRILELLPLLLRILTPEIKIANIQVLKQHESSVIERLVSLLKAFGLRLQTETTHNRVLFKLEPPIDTLGGSGLETMQYAVKQLISTMLTQPKRHLTPQSTPRLAKLQLTPQVIEEKTMRGFFQPKKEQQIKTVKQSIVYKFKEGYSNAVRKPVSLKDFMSS
ncbi:P-loop containing nucleoside triphosphate hydrolase protein [Gorgonomyces haynaldii]|nr:P-loop containing nucleoside triphosphate hydrolase protein [Gorgonomyces haynaldii]